jgi:hypothetical protein
MTRNDAIIDASLPQLAEYFISVLTDDGIVDKAAELTKVFKSYADYLKENVAPGEPDQGDITSGRPRINDDEDVNVLDPKLERMIAAAMALPVNRGTDREPVTTPPMSRQEAINWLMRTAEGRSFAAHHAKTTKKAEPMIDILKLHNIQSVVEVAKSIIAKNGDGITEHQFSEILMGHARLNKQARESDAAAFSRIFQDPDNADLRKAYAMTKGYCQP